MISLTLRLPLHTKKERPVPHWLRERVGCKVGLDAKWVWTQSGSGRSDIHKQSGGCQDVFDTNI